MTSSLGNSGSEPRGEAVAEKPGVTGRRGTREHSVLLAARVHQDASDSDQTASDADQTSSDGDQVAADSDRDSSDADQASSDRDQLASDQESAGSADQHDRERASAERDLSTRARDRVARNRERAADSRATDADGRDRSATERDRTATVRDAAAEALDEETSRGEEPELQRKQKRIREHAANDRARAAEDRRQAAADRARASAERAEAVRERTKARCELAQAALDLKTSETDELTHVRRRGAGLQQLQREMDRACRIPERLAVAFIDVDGLKAVNDAGGHAAGDTLLVAVADCLRACLRSYDLIVRVGGDEFVCAVPNMELDAVRERFAEASAALARSPTGGSITVGVAELADGDFPSDVIARADADLLAQRQKA
jgi:diguanylate cyclase (GGDEF)-like protein